MLNNKLMTKFIELTEYDDQPIMVNVVNIIWVRPYKDDEGSTIYVTAQGRNGYPMSINVKETYSQVVKLIQR